MYLDAGNANVSIVDSTFEDSEGNAGEVSKLIRKCIHACIGGLLYTYLSTRDRQKSRMPSDA